MVKNNYYKKYIYNITLLCCYDIFYYIFNTIKYYLIYSKYCLYFILLINTFFVNILYFKITNKLSDNLLKLLHNIINLNGCVLIKMIQWTLNNIKIFYTDINGINSDIILNIFDNFYEDCYIHNLNYTKKLFKNEFNINFEDEYELYDLDNIKSGSIAQIYKAKFKNSFNNNNIAIKVVHPELHYQIFFPKLLSIIINKLFFFPFSFDSFFDNLDSQICMNKEFENMKFFYNKYFDNSMIIIPKPILSSNNILIMEYIEGNKFDDIDISINEKQKLILIITLFIKDNYYFSEFIHSDLHDGNWKIIKINNIYKIIIYDFGYIIKNHINEIYKNLLYYSDLNDHYNVCNIFYQCINNKTNISNKQLYIDFQQYANYIFQKKYIYTSEYIEAFYKYCFYKKYKMKNYVFECFISSLLFKKYINKYIYHKCLLENRDDFINSLIQLNIYYYNLCNEFNIFPELKQLLYNQYINNNIFISKYKYTNKYIQNLQNSQNNDINNQFYI